MKKHIKTSASLLASLLAFSAVSGRAGFVDRTAELVPDGSALGSADASWGDYNRDGYPDLNTANGVWRNHGGTNFTKVAQYGPGPWGDVNNDGYLDLFRYSLPCQIVLYYPETDTFAVSDEPEVATPKSPRAACWADFNGNGLIDLYVGGYETWDPAASYPDSILTNCSDGTMVMAWEQTGTIRRARGVTACDFDEDGDMDIYVSNYRLQPNILWKNDGTGVFTDVAKAYGVDGDKDQGAYGHTIGSAWGDLDNDGHFDLFVGNFSHPPAYQDRPKFYRNLGPDGDYHFEDKSAGAGLAWQESYASPTLIDYDNDGYLDLYFTTVYDGDHPVLYRNNGDWTFTDVTAAEGLAGLGKTYQAAWADLNNDGFLDLITGGKLFINSGNKNHWIQITLEGDGTDINRAAIGAQVRIGWKGMVLTRQVEGGTGEGNQNDLRLHFGLGDQTDPVTIEIAWPNGVKQTVHNLAVDQFYHITPGPVLTTTAEETPSVTDRTALLKGALLSEGTAPAPGGTEVCVQWGSSPDELSSQAWIENVELGAFSYLLTDLLPNTRYYYRFCTTNANGQYTSTALGNFMTTGTLPFQETFDPLTIGSIDGQNGWCSSEANAALVQSEITYGGSSKACFVQRGHLWHDFVVPDTPPIVWNDFWIIPQQTEDSNASLLIEGDENTAALVCVEAEGGYLNVMDGQVPRLLDTHLPIQPGQWMRLTLRLNYLSKTWDIWLNEILVAKNLAFFSPTAATIHQFVVKNGFTTDPAILDDFTLSTVRPEDFAMVDRDDDGLDDDWEYFYFGSLTATGGGESEDWDNDGFPDRFEFRAGTDPTDPDSFLGISRFIQHSPSHAMLEWRSVEGKRYAIQKAHALTGGWESVYCDLPGEPFFSQETIPLPDESPVFFRVLLLD